MNKTLYTLNIGNFAPKITALTYPLLKRYAAKIGAEFVEITDRKFPGWPTVYEKLQIFELGRDRKDDWSLFLDADALVSPDMFDLTAHIGKDSIFHMGSDPASIRFTWDDYFRRDNRNFGSCTWCAMASDWTRDLFRPLEDLTLEEATARIHPTILETNASEQKSAASLIDDFTMSRNIARFGLKTVTGTQLFNHLGMQPSGFWHIYTKTPEEKLTEMQKALATWGVTP